MGTTGTWYSTLNAINQQELDAMTQAADMSILNTKAIRDVIRLKAQEQGVNVQDEEIMAVLNALDWMQKALVAMPKR